MNDETKDRLAAHALRAEDEADRAQTEAALEADPDLRAEADRYEHVTQALVEVFPPVEPDEEVWERIEARIEPRTSDASPVPAAARRPVWPLLLSAAALLAVVVGTIAVLGFGGDGSMTLEAAADALRGESGAIVRELTDPASGVVTMSVVTGTDGTSYATVDGLESLPGEQTYQLWSVVDDEIVSVGLLGHDPSTVALRLEGDPAVLALTVERAGGVAVSQAQPVAVWAAEA